MHRLVVFYDHIRSLAEQEGISLQAACEKARAMGYSAVNMNLASLADAQSPLPVLKDSGLEINSAFFFASFGDKTQQEDRQEALSILARAREAQIPCLLAIPGFLRGQEEMQRGSAAYLEKREKMASALSFLVREAEKAGICVLMEDFDGIEAPLCFADELEWFLQHVPGLGCAFDTGNFLYGNEDALALLPRFIAGVRDVHLKDRGLVPNDSAKQLSVNGTALYTVPVGSGVIPIESIVKELLARGYSGSFAAEMYGSAHMLPDMERSALYLKELLA